MQHPILRCGISVLATSLIVLANDASAFRMIQNTGVGTFSAGAAVTCTNPTGFTHWGVSNTTWYLNPARQGAGKQTAIQNSLSAWTGVSPAGYTLSYGGTTSAGLSGTDGLNTLLWKKSGLCAGNCLAITLLTLQAGQVITDVDVQFNDRYSWQTNGSNVDTQAVATHEVGHGMGIHHTELTSTPRPTMYAAYFGTDGRTLESDDSAALNCAHDRYPPSAPARDRAIGMSESLPLASVQPITLSTRVSSGATLVRFSLPVDDAVRLDIVDASGRLVTTLAEGTRHAGDHELAWNGSTSWGTAAQSGIYFARLSTSEGNQSAKVLLLH